MSTTRPAQPGLRLSIIGGTLMVVAAVLLIPGIDALNAIRFGEGGGSPAGAYWLIAAGGVVLMLGGGSLAAGRRRHAADMNRPRGYGDQRDDHTIAAEDRKDNPNDTSAQGYQTG